MSANVVVDSSFFISRLRRGVDPFAELSESAEEHDFYTCGVVMIEVLRSMKPEKARARLESLMGAMMYVPTLNHTWERAMMLAWQLDRKGRVMQVTDLIIASCALELEAAVLTLDSDFSAVPGLKVLSALS
jgi:predicted nucleic acid-binding protein